VRGALARVLGELVACGLFEPHELSAACAGWLDAQRAASGARARGAAAGAHSAVVGALCDLCQPARAPRLRAARRSLSPPDRPDATPCDAPAVCLEAQLSLAELVAALVRAHPPRDTTSRAASPGDRAASPEDRVTADAAVHRLAHDLARTTHPHVCVATDGTPPRVSLAGGSVVQGR
jgi:hypothetical protein